MPAKIRLQRKGKKGQPFYHIVIADGRAPREGRFIERIGTYNPLSNPAEIDLNFDKAIDWMQKGAQPTDTVKALLSFKGVLYKFHLLQGVKKGAMTIEQAEAKFQAWYSEKQEKIVSKIKETALIAKDKKKEQVAHEVELNEAKAAAVAKKLAKVAEAQAAARKEVIAEMQAKAEVEAAAAAKIKADAHVTEEVAPEVKEDVVTEAKDEVLTEVKEEVVAEVKEEVVAEVNEEIVTKAKKEVAAEPEAASQEPETPAEEPKQE